MMRGTQLPAASLFEVTPHDLAPYLEQLHGNLTRVARAIVQLDKRLKHLEKQVGELIEAEPAGWGHPKAGSWGRRRTER